MLRGSLVLPIHFLRHQIDWRNGDVNGWQDGSAAVLLFYGILCLRAYLAVRLYCEAIVSCQVDAWHPTAPCLRG
jgi:hypothetical protein